MKQNRPSHTAASVAIISALRWYTGDKNTVLQAELLRNLPRRFMIPFVWILMNVILWHPFLSKCYLFLLEHVFGLSQLCQGVWLRKDYMEQQVRNFLRQQNHQHPHHSSTRSNHEKIAHSPRVIILAAGYDMLAFRLAHEFPNVSFIELDHPSTGEVKLSALSRLCNKNNNNDKKQSSVKMLPSSDSLFLPKNLLFCHEALGKGRTIRDALEKNGIDLTDAALHPTVIVMEGLTFYLTEQENRNVFREIGEIFGSDADGDGSDVIVAFDFFNMDRHGRPVNPNNTTHPFMSSWMSSAMKYKVALVGEPFRWGMAPEHIESFFEGTGWELVPPQVTMGLCAGGEGHFKYATAMGFEFVATVQWKRKRS